MKMDENDKQNYMKYLQEVERDDLKLIIRN